MSAQTSSATTETSRPPAASRRGSWFASPPPAVAVEIGAGRVTAVVLGTVDGAPAVTAQATERLPDGLVAPSLTTPNLTDKPAVAAAVQRVLRAVGVSRGRVALVVPDGAAKVSVVRFEKVPTKAEDLAQLVRWQVRKSVPFPLEQTQVSWTPGVADANGADYVVTVARQDIVADYEQAVSAAGVQVGLVDLATFNLVNLLLAGDAGASRGDWLLVHVTPDASTMAIVRDGALLLFRHRPIDGDGSLADLGHQTSMYYEDRLNGQGLSRAVLAARDVSPGVLGDIQALAAALEQRVGKPVVEIDTRSLVHIAAEAATGGDRVTIAAPLGVLLRERVS
ncbi:MAG: pilus assembly protein PilM [Vicinamibacteraceae bacterium]